MQKQVTILFSIGILLFLNSCYSFRGVSIDCDTSKTFTVQDFPNYAQTVVPTLSQTFVEGLKNKVRSNTCLSLTTANGDVGFNGSIVRYEISSLAPEAGETTAFNRLTISVRIEYINNNNEKENWEKDFSRFADFPSTSNLLSLQDRLIAEINDEIITDVFRAAFENW